MSPNRTNRRAQYVYVCLCACLRACLCGLPACPHDNLLCMKSAVAAAAAAGCLILRSSHFCLLVQRFCAICQSHARHEADMQSSSEQPEGNQRTGRAAAHALTTISNSNPTTTAAALRENALYFYIKRSYLSKSTLNFNKGVANFLDT